MIHQARKAEIKLSISVTFLTGIIPVLNFFFDQIALKLQLKKSRALLIHFNDVSNRVEGIGRCY